MNQLCRSVLLSLPCLFLAESLQFKAEAAPSATDSANLPSRYSQLGPWSISAGFPNGGSIWGTPAFGVRNELSEGEFIAVGLQLSANKEEKSESAGLMAKWQHMMFTPVARAFPYVFFQAGVQSVKESDATKSETSLLTAIGLGVEVSLLREISTSFETGFGGVFLPSSKINYSAATTQLSLHYHFQY